MNKITKTSFTLALLIVGITLAFGVSVHAARTATAVAEIENGSVVKIQLIDNGSGYSETPEVSFVGGGGTGAVVSLAMYQGMIGGVNIVNGGGGYTEPPKVIIQSPYANTLKNNAKYAIALSLICAVLAVGYFAKKSKSIGNVAKMDLGNSKKVVFAGVALLVLGFSFYAYNMLHKSSNRTDSQSASSSVSISMSDVAGHWANADDMVDITLNSIGSCKYSYGHNDPSRGAWHLNGNTVVIDAGDGGAPLSFVYKDGKLITPNGHSLTPQ